MFNNFLSNGSVLAVVLMVLASVVIVEIKAMHRERGSGYARLNLPPFMNTPLGDIVQLALLPTLLWPAVYIALFDGVVAGVVAFVGFSVVAFALRRTVEPMIGLWFIAAGVAALAGYALSLTHLP